MGELLSGDTFEQYELSVGIQQNTEQKNIETTKPVNVYVLRFLRTSLMM